MTTDPTPHPRKRHRLAKVIGILAVCAVALVACVAALNSSPRPASSPAGAVATGSAQAAPNAPTIRAVPAETPGTAASPAPAVAEFGPGTYDIGTGDGEMPPGKYKASGPDGSVGGVCYAATLKNNDGAIGDIVDQKVSQGQTLLTVPKTGAHYVDIRGCTFRKVG